MKLNHTEISVENEKHLLILSDGKPGHVNQSIAFARHLGYAYDLVPVAFKYRCNKGLSYLADWFGGYSTALCMAEIPGKQYFAVVSAGSGTYYANRTLAKKLGCKAIAIMLPRGYRLGFDLIVAQQHDNPPERSNILAIPINLTYVEPQGHVVGKKGECYASFVIGGDCKRGKMDVELLRRQLDQIGQRLPQHKLWLTTSHRTPVAIEEMLRTFVFDYAIYYSERTINPIADFLKYSDYVFITEDSTSMISEAVSYGQAKVEILPLSEKHTLKTKADQLISHLETQSCLHVYDGQLGETNHKIDLGESIRTGALKCRLGVAG